MDCWSIILEDKWSYCGLTNNVKSTEGWKQKTSNYILSIFLFLLIFIVYFAYDFIININIQYINVKWELIHFWHFELARVTSISNKLVYDPGGQPAPTINLVSPGTHNSSFSSPAVAVTIAGTHCTYTMDRWPGCVSLGD